MSLSLCYLERWTDVCRREQLPFEGEQGHPVGRWNQVLRLHTLPQTSKPGLSPQWVWRPIAQSRLQNVKPFFCVIPSLIHITDWLPTLLHAAGGDPEPLVKSGIDGIDQWQSLLHGQPSKRTEMLYNINPKNDGSSGGIAAMAGPGAAYR